jgi:hypothetical protein
MFPASTSLSGVTTTTTAGTTTTTTTTPPSVFDVVPGVGGLGSPFATIITQIANFGRFGSVDAVLSALEAQNVIRNLAQPDRRRRLLRTSSRFPTIRTLPQSPPAMRPRRSATATGQAIT